MTLTTMTAKKMVSFRLPPHLIEFADQYASQTEGVKDRTDLVKQLLEALQEGRLSVRPRPAPNPFPADEFCTEEE